MGATAPLRILVTGCHGAVGAMVVRECLARGDEPVGLDRNPDGAFLRDVAGRYTFVAGDVLDWPRLLETARRQRIGAVIHTAALLPDLASANPYQAVQVNVVGTANLVEVALDLGVRLVYTSTKGVLDDFAGACGHPAYRPVAEDHPVIPPRNAHTLYNDTKVFCEHYLNRLEVLRGLDHVILRFASMYGPGRQRHGGRAILSEMVEAALRGEPYQLAQGGEQRDDAVYTRDVAAACVLAAHAPQPASRTYHIGSGRLIAYAEAAEAVRRVLPGARIAVGPGLDPFRIGFATYGLLDIGRARAELGYEPCYPVEEGVRDYVAVLRTLGLAG